MYVLLKIIRTFRYHLAAFAVNFSFFVTERKWPNFSPKEFVFFVNSGILYHKKTDVIELKHKFDRGSALIIRGNYHDGLKIKSEVLNTIYEFSEINFESYYPPLLHPSWLENIGHVITISYLRHAETLGIVPSGPRFALCSGRSLADEKTSTRRGAIMQALELNTPMINFPADMEWHDAILLSPIIERAEIVKGHSAFIEKVALMNQVLFNHFSRSNTPFITLKSNYLEKCERLLKHKFGIDIASDWFVVLHIRETGNPLDTKSSDLKSYLPALNEVTKRGGNVIRIGTNIRSKFPTRPGFFDCSDFNKDPDFLLLHAFLLKFAKFVISTHSGPRALCHGLATPTLSLNLVSPAQNLWPGHQSISIPKHFFKGSSELSFHEVIKSRFGYAETEKLDYQISGVSVVDNTHQEIIDATREMFSLLESDADLDLSSKNRSIKDILEASNSPSKGFVSSSFLSKMGDWYTS